VRCENPQRSKSRSAHGRLFLLPILIFAIFSTPYFFEFTFLTPTSELFTFGFPPRSHCPYYVECDIQHLFLPHAIYSPSVDSCQSPVSALSVWDCLFSTSACYFRTLLAGPYILIRFLQFGVFQSWPIRLCEAMSWCPGSAAVTF